jgi:hypothetical protein
MVDLSSVGMHETNGVLIHPQNGKAMQVRLEKDKAGVQYRLVPAEKMDDTEDGDQKVDQRIRIHPGPVEN